MDVNQLLQIVTWNLTNEANRSPVRQFAYQTMSYNNWNNQEMTRLVDFILMKGKYDAYRGIQLSDASIAEAITVFISEMALRNPQVVQTLRPEVVGALQSNASIFTTIMNGGQMYQNQAPAPSNPAAMSNYGMQQQQKPFSHFGRKSITPSRGGAQNVQQQVQQPVAQPVQQATQQPVLQPLKEEEMDKRLHEMAYLLNYQPPKERIVELRNETLNAMRKSATSTVLFDTADGEVVFKSELSITDAVESSYTELLHLDLETASKSEAYLVVNTIPIVVSENGLKEKVSDCNTFIALAAVLQQHGSSYTNDVEKESAFNYIMQIDRYLTKRVNEHLDRLYDVPLCHIDSFIEDISGLSGYIGKKVGMKAVNNLSDLEQSILYDLKLGCSKEFNIDDGLNLDQEVIALTECYAIHALNYSLSSIGYTSRKDVMLIAPIETSTLHAYLKQCVQSARKQSIHNNILLLKDGASYYIYPNGSGDGTYKLYRL